MPISSRRVKSASATIDEIPLEWCMGNGVLLDFRHKADGERITAKDVQGELDRIRYEIQPLDIVLVQTGADAFWGKPEYLVKGAGMDRESTLFLTEKGVRVVGIDAWSWDYSGIARRVHERTADLTYAYKKNLLGHLAGLQARVSLAWGKDTPVSVDAALEYLRESGDLTAEGMYRKADSKLQVLSRLAQAHTAGESAEKVEGEGKGHEPTADGVRAALPWPASGVDIVEAVATDVAASQD